MRFKAQIDGKEHSIEAQADGSLSIDGEKFSFKLDAPDTDRRVVQIGDKTYDIRVVERKADTGEYLLEIAGERVRISVSEVVKETQHLTAAAPVTTGSATAPAASGRTGTAEQGDRGSKIPEQVTDGVWAPVPGKIVNVLVRPGEQVKEGQPLIVLEAMKMENELHATRDGTVTAVLVSKGDQVERGQLLVALA